LEGSTIILGRIELLHNIFTVLLQGGRCRSFGERDSLRSDRWSYRSIIGFIRVSFGQTALRVVLSHSHFCPDYFCCWLPDSRCRSVWGCLVNPTTLGGMNPTRGCVVNPTRIRVMSNATTVVVNPTRFCSCEPY
jgi:hypothetical protein